MHQYVFCSNISQISLSIVFQIIWHAKPEDTKQSTFCESQQVKGSQLLEHLSEEMTLNLGHRVTGVSALTDPDTLTRLLFFCLTSNFHRLFQLWSFLFLHQHHHLSRIQLCLHWAGMFHVAVGERTENLYPFSRTHHRGLSEKSKHKKHPIGGDQWCKQTPASRKRGFYLAS